MNTMEDRPEQSEAYYRLLIENSPDIVTVLEADGTVRYASPAVQRVLGYAPEERVGTSIGELVHPEDLPAIMSALDEALQDRRQSATFEYRCQHKDGSWRLLEAAAGNVLHHPGVNGIVVFTRDVTDRRRAQEVLRQSEGALRDSEAQLRALTGRLLTCQEQEWARIAGELHDDLGQKLAFLAVEAEKLEQRFPESPDLIRDRLRALRHRAVDLLEDVGRMAHRLRPSVLDGLGLGPALRSYCRDFSRLEGIPVKFSGRNLPGSLPREIALCLYRVVQEGLLNIGKHSRAPGAAVTLSGMADAVRLSIRDSGIGFNPDVREGKSGLGIASMKERVRLVHGRILIESEPGKGTRIRIHVPLPRSTHEQTSTASRR